MRGYIAFALKEAGPDGYKACLAAYRLGKAQADRQKNANEPETRDLSAPVLLPPTTAQNPFQTGKDALDIGKDAFHRVPNPPINDHHVPNPPFPYAPPSTAISSVHLNSRDL